MSEIQLYTTQEAAEYLGIPQRTLQYHIYTSLHIEPDFNNGRALLFRKETLDEFKEKYRSEEGLSMKEAAEYLGLSFHGIRHHVFVSHRLVPDAKRGRFNVFFRSTLDAFAAENTKWQDEDDEPEPAETTA